MARAGRMTASRADDMLAVGKNGQPLASRANLRAQLALEQLLHRPISSTFQTPAMLTGVEREPRALAAYEAARGVLVTRTGFLAHTELMAGASLDGHLGDFEHLIEVKCCQPTAHLDVLRSGLVPDGYIKQVVHQAWLTGARTAEVVFWNPDFPERLQLRIIDVPVPNNAVELYDAAVRAFLAEVTLAVHELEKL